MLLVWIHNRYGGGDGPAFDYHLRKEQ